MEKPNDYTRADVLRLARIIDPTAWVKFREEALALDHGTGPDLWPSPDHPIRCPMGGYHHSVPASWIKPVYSPEYDKASAALNSSIGIAARMLSFGYRDCRLP